MKMKRIVGGAVVSSLVAAALTVAAQPSRTDTRLLPTAVKLEDGLTVQPLAIKWMVGPWQHAHDRTKRFEIKKHDTGAYLMTPVGGGEGFRLTVFKMDCYRLVEMRSIAPGQAGRTYALLSGHAERLSLDALPATFPNAWRDKELIAAVGEGAFEELPATKRGEALVWLIGQLDEVGTLMKQDMTYFRPQDEEK